MITLGLDLSMVATGYVRTEAGKVREQKLIKSKPPQRKTPLAETQRLLSIIKEIDMEGVDLVSIEGVAMMARHSVSLVQLSGLNYLTREKAVSAQIPFLVIPPSSLKKFISGKGNASKEEMMAAVRERYGIAFQDDNLCDAFSLAVCAEEIWKTLPGENFPAGDATINNLRKQII